MEVSKLQSRDAKAKAFLDLWHSRTGGEKVRHPTPNLSGSASIYPHLLPPTFTELNSKKRKIYVPPPLAPHGTDSDMQADKQEPYASIF
jgi:hypothetical protein